MHNENWTTILLLKRRKASQKSFISFFNTLSRVRTPPNPATKNVTIPALFTTWNEKWEKKQWSFLSVLYSRPCVWQISNNLIPLWLNNLKWIWYILLLIHVDSMVFFNLNLRLCPLHLHCCQRQEMQGEETQGTRLGSPGTNPRQSNQPCTHTRNCTVFNLSLMCQNGVNNAKRPFTYKIQNRYCVSIKL